MLVKFSFLIRPFAISSTRSQILRRTGQARSQNEIFWGATKILLGQEIFGGGGKRTVLATKCIICC